MDLLEFGLNNIGTIQTLFQGYYTIKGMLNRPKKPTHSIQQRGRPYPPQRIVHPRFPGRYQPMRRNHIRTNFDKFF